MMKYPIAPAEMGVSAGAQVVFIILGSNIGDVMKLFPLILILVFLLSACATPKYSGGQSDITQAPDAQLLREASDLSAFQRTMYASDTGAKELGTIQRELIRRYPDWDWSAITRGVIKVGWTADQVGASWGYPLYKNTSGGRYGSREQWVYVRGGYAKQYVYFENGKVSGWDDAGF